jgi:hypothetical protein
MGKGYWLNPENDHWVQVDAHEISMKDKQDQKALGLTKGQILVLDLAKGNEDNLRMHAIKTGLIRIRDYQDGVHVQFYAERSSVRKYLESLFYMVKRTSLKQSWNIAIENMHPGAKDFASLPMEEFIKAIDNGKAIMKESKKK